MAINFTECFKRSICCLFKNPKRDMTYAWIISLVLVLVVFIVACVAAARISKGTGNSQQNAQDSTASFIAVWTSLLLLFISVTGTVIMRRYQAALSIGFLLGIIFVMANQMLIVFAVFAERSQDQTITLVDKQAVQAMAVFTFFLFLIYAIFGTMLAVFRDDIIKQEVSQVDPDEYRQNPSYNENADGQEENQI